MRILFVQEYYYPYIGGIENLFKALAESLAKRGHEVFVVTSKYDKQLPEEEVINGVFIRRINTRSRILFAIKALLPVFRLSRKSDLIQTTTYTGVMPALIAGKLARKKVIVTYHEFWGKLWFKLPFLSPAGRIANFVLENIIARLPYDKIVAVSGFTKQSLEENNIKASKIVRIYNGLDYSQFEGYAQKIPDKFTFTYFGRLGVSKGLDLLIEAAGMFLKENRNAGFKLIIPTIPKKMHKRITGMTEKFNLGQQLEILSNLSKQQLYNEICTSHCVVIPSYSEGFCFTAVESIALGMPVISSDMGALKEVVSGKFIKLKRLTKQDIYQALVDAKDGKWELSTVKKFDLKTQVNSYENLYESLVSRDKIND